MKFVQSPSNIASITFEPNRGGMFPQKNEPTFLWGEIKNLNQTTMLQQNYQAGRRGFQFSFYKLGGEKFIG